MFIATVEKNRLLSNFIQPVRLRRPCRQLLARFITSPMRPHIRLTFGKTSLPAAGLPESSPRCNGEPGRFPLHSGTFMATMSDLTLYYKNTLVKSNTACRVVKLGSVLGLTGPAAIQSALAVVSDSSPLTLQPFFRLVDLWGVFPAFLNLLVFPRSFLSSVGLTL